MSNGFKHPGSLQPIQLGGFFVGEVNRQVVSRLIAAIASSRLRITAWSVFAGGSGAQSRETFGVFIGKSSCFPYRGLLFDDLVGGQRP